MGCRALGIAVLALAVTGCSGEGAHRRAGAQTSIRSDGQGISVRLPSGWHARIANSRFDYPDAAVVYLANFPIPPNNDEAVTEAEGALLGRRIRELRPVGELPR